MSGQATHHHDVHELRELRPVSRPLEVALLHEDEIMRCGLETLLQVLPRVGPVQVFRTTPLAREALTRSRPDILLLPAALGPAELQELLATAQQVGTKTLLILNALDRDSVRRASRLAADGFLLEFGLTADALTHAVAAVSRGEIPVPPSLVRELLSEVKTGGRQERGPQLTPREEAALALLVEGMSNKQIARRLGISEHGAKRHVSNVLAKLNCPNRTVAAVVAVQDGLIAAPAH